MHCGLFYIKMEGEERKYNFEIFDQFIIKFEEHQCRFKIGLANINFMPTIFKIMQFRFDALFSNSINTLLKFD